MLNTTSAILDRTFIEVLSPESVALSLEDPPIVDETKQALRYMANGKAMELDELPAELLKLRLSNSSHEILLAFHDIIVAVWMTGEVPQERKDATTMKVLHKKKDQIEYGNYRGLSLVVHAGKVFLPIVANRLLRGSWDSSRGTVRLPASTLGNRYDAHLAQTTGAGIDRQHFTRDLLHRSGKSMWLCRSCTPTEAFPHFGVSPRIIKAIHMFHDGMRTRVQLDDGDFSARFNVCQVLRQGFVLSPLLFNTFCSAIIIVVLQPFAADLIIPDFVYLDDAPNSEDDKPKEEGTL